MTPAPLIADDSARPNAADTHGNGKKVAITPLQALSQGVCLPGIPTFNSFERQRQWMLEHMAGAFRVFARKGYTEGISGHISVRDPEWSDAFWTNPLGRHFGLLRASDMILVNHAGEPIGGNRSRPANAAGFLIHSAIHRARPDVVAACHTHSRFGKAWSTFGKPLEMLNQDICYLYGDAQAVYNEFGGIVLGEQAEEEAKRMAAALGPRGKGMVLLNHGLLTVGGTVDEAAFLHCLMENACEIQLSVEAASANGLKKKLVSDEEAKYTFDLASDPETLFWEFQPDLDFEDEMSEGAFRK